MPDPPQCPDCRTLERFLLGQNTPEEAAAIEAHLELCAPCLAALQTLPADDSMVEAMQARKTVADIAMNDGARLLADWLKKLRPAVGSTVSYDLPPEPTPTELGQYQLRRVLGSGGMGIVFEAYDRQLDRLVALKTMLPAQAANPAASQRFLREAKAAAGIKHDHIVTIYQVGEDRGIAFLAMELLEGETLGQRLDREGRLPLPVLLRIARECAEALAAAHAKGLIHRDIKPANIWLESVVRGPWSVVKDSAALSLTTDDGPRTTDFRVKLLDFGLARASDETTQLTLTGALIGTPAFMAPEQLLGQPVDARADLFSLGCVLYRMATGTAPFKAAHSISTLIAIATTNPRAPQDLNADLPLPLCALIMRLLAKRASERPSSAQAVVETLRAMEHGSDQDIRPPTAAKRRLPWPIWVTAAALFAYVLAWAAFQAWPTPEDGGAAKIEAPAKLSQDSAPAEEDPANTVTGTGVNPTRLHADRTRGFQDVLDFRDLIGAGVPEFRDWQARLEPGFRLAFVTCRRGMGPAMLNAVAVREKTQHLTRVPPELTSVEAIDAEGHRNTDLDQFSLLDHCTYPVQRTGWAQVRIWIKDQVEYLSWNADRWNIKLKLAEQKGLGRRPRGVQWLPIDPWPHQIIVANDDEGRGWETSYSLSPEEVVRAAQRLEHKRWRPDMLVPFWENDQLRFLMIAVENADGPEWRMRLDMSAESYRQESARQRQLGFFPLCLASYSMDADARYVAIWVRGRARGSAPPPPEVVDQQTVADRAVRAVSWAGTAHGLFKDEAYALYDIRDFQQIVGATGEQLKGWHARLDPTFRVARIGSRKGNGPVLFNAVAVRQDNPPPHRFLVGLTQEELVQKSRELQVDDTFRPLAICANLSAGQKPPWHHAGLWVQDGQAHAFCAGFIDDVAKGNEDCKADMRPISLEALESPDGLACNSTVGPHQGRKWETFYALNHDELLPTIEFYRRKGWRPDLITPYVQGDKLRSMLVVVDNSDNVDWRFRMDMSRAECEDESKQQKQRGLFPLALASYGHDDAVRYAAIFVRYR